MATCTEEIVGLIGVGCAGSYILNKLSKKYRMVAFEAGIDRRYDGVTFNLAIAAPAVTNPLSKVAAQHPVGWTLPPAQQWAGITFNPIYNTSTIIANPGPGIIPQNWTQGVMIGGSNEHIQGVCVKPSRSQCEWWASITRNKRFAFDNLFSLLNDMESFNDHYDPTTQTYDGTLYAPLNGPSILGSNPLNRGYEGTLQVIQSSPSPFSINLSKAVYRYFRDNHVDDNILLTPIVSATDSLTFNSGVNTTVTQCPETFLNVHRTRSSMARAYLGPSVMMSTTPDVPSGNANYTINNGPYVGINGHNFDLILGAKIQRIVFKKNRCGVYVFPLVAHAIEYATSGGTITVPVSKVICSLGTMGTPALLMQSGIGDKALLESLGIEAILDQPNLGKYVGNHQGSRITWTSTNPQLWGNTPIGTDNANCYLIGPDHPTRRKFQVYTSYSAATIPESWTLSIYDLNPKSTGTIKTAQAWDNTSNATITITAESNYYSDPHGDDKRNLCWIVRHLTKAVIAADPSASFVGLPLDSDDDVLFAALMKTFTAQSHQVGSCGMGRCCKVHCVNTKFKLRGTENVFVCDASSVPLEKAGGVVYPVQNDGNTSYSVNSMTAVFVQQVMECGFPEC